MKKNHKIESALVILILGMSFILSINLHSQTGQKQSSIERIASPALTILDENNKKQGLEIRKLDIDIKIVGKLAVTTLDLTFHNNKNRVLEGELDFPLSDGQSVSRFAMELNGKLREGVVVEKAKGRIAYESTIRQKIDPALLEKTSGNSFRSRVYPIPANGDKRIVIAYEEIIKEDEDGMIYQLPLNYQDVIAKFKLTAKIFNDDDVLEDGTGNQFDDLQIRKEGSAYVIGAEYENYLANKQFNLRLKSPDSRKSIMVEKFKDKDYFYIDVNTDGESKVKKYPDSICILWDASSSSVNRNITDELKLLSAYLQSINNCRVNLVVFSNSIHTEKEFIIQNGNTDELEDELNNIQYDGGTQLGILNLNKYDAGEFLLFSDGMSNFGKNEIVTGNVPIYTINSNQVANHSYLKFISQVTGGKFINLANQEIDKALDLLGKNLYQFISAEYLSNEIEQTYPSIPQTIDGSFILTGILKNEKARVKLNFGYGKEITYSEYIDINKDENKTESGLISRIWAQKKLAEFDMMYEKNKEEIKEIGKEFNLITRGTSLIILDRVQDYVRYKIVPPEELLDEYLDLVENERKDKFDDSLNHAKSVISNFKQEINWWQRSFDIPKVEKKIDTITKINSYTSNGQVPTNGTSTLKGTVLNKDGVGIIGASVYIEGTNRGTYVRKKDGRFEIYNIPPGDYSVRISSIGFKTVKKQINLDTNSIVEVETVLNSDTNNTSINEIVIIDSRYIIEHEKGSIYTFQRSRDEDGNIRVDGIDISQFFTGGFGASGSQEGGDGVDLGGFSSNIDLEERQEVAGFAQNVPDGSVTLSQLADEINRDGADLLGELPDSKVSPAFTVGSTNAVSGTMILDKGNINKRLLINILGSGIDSIYSKYLIYKKENINNIEYYIEVADVFMKLNDTANALRVISNLAELKLEDYQTLRILAYKLKQYGKFDLSEIIFRDIINLREEEPQSYRDLALVLPETGKYQEAADLLYQIAFKKWDNRFYGFDVIVLNEFNRLIALNPDKIDTKNYNPELLKEMPVDIRAVLNWDTDNSDIDLMLTDPTGITCSYGKKLTRIGCKISNDFTGGYGPEEIKLKNAIPGKYILKANFYGTRSDRLNIETTLSLELFIKYATKEEEKKEITLRLKNIRQKVNIGEFIFE